MLKFAKIFKKLAQMQAVQGKPANSQHPAKPTKLEQPLSSSPQKKPWGPEKDRFGGASGEERQQLIEAEAKKKGFILVPHKMTPLNKMEVLQAEKKIISNEMPDLNSSQVNIIAQIITSQIGIETGFKSCHNYNVGNYHSLSGDYNKYWKGKTAVWDDPQIGKSGNKYINKDTFWRAYDNLENGIGDQFLHIKKRFPKALEYAKAGDIVGFATELGTKGYFSKHVIDSYIKGMTSIHNSLQNEINKSIN